MNNSKPTKTQEPETMRVKPRGGFILAGIPAEGADVPIHLAYEWIANGLVVKVENAKKPD